VSSTTYPKITDKIIAQAIDLELIAEIESIFAAATLAGLDLLMLPTYDLYVLNISGGKDSQTMLRLFMRLVDILGLDRRKIVCVFADLGAEDEWAGTEELAREHAAHYGVRFIKVQKGENNDAPITLLQHIINHGKWPNLENRFCTSDMKRDPIGTVITMLCDELRSAWKAMLPKGCKARVRRVRILNCMGMRAQESPARAKLVSFEKNKRVTNETVKDCDNWLPIHGLTEHQVWADIKASGVRHHWVYDAGMPRLSCRFCVLAGRKALVRAAQLDPDGAVKRAEAEEKMGHTFGRDFTMRDIIAEAEALTARGEVAVAKSWNC